MIRNVVRFALPLTLLATPALADGVTGTASTVRATTAAAATNTPEPAALHPGAGRVRLRIHVTHARRVFLPASVATAGAERGNDLRYVCTTPCVLYVQPGAVNVTLEGWNTHTYSWDVPSSGGCVSLAARTPDGRLATEPRETARNETARSVP